MAKELKTGNCPKGIKNITAYLTDHLNKHGELRGANKEETRRLRDMCLHHKITKKGKTKPAVTNDGNGTCYCPMCGHKFSTHLWSEKEIKEKVAAVMNVLDQSKFMTVSADFGKEVEKYLVNLSVELGKLPKIYKKQRKVVEKRDHVKNKKKKKSYNNTSSSSYGSWRY